MKFLGIEMDIEIAFIFYAILIGATIFASKYIIGWYYEIPKRIKYMEAQLRLLEKIAEKQGVDANEIYTILTKAELPKNEIAKE